MRVLLIAAILAALSVPARSECLSSASAVWAVHSWINIELEAAAARPRRRKMLVRQIHNLRRRRFMRGGSRFSAQNGVLQPASDGQTNG